MNCRKTIHIIFEESPLGATQIANEERGKRDFFPTIRADDVSVRLALGTRTVTPPEENIPMEGQMLKALPARRKALPSTAGLSVEY
jgi:hypothetical protein